MKILTFPIAVCAFLMAPFQIKSQIPNPGIETWSNVTVSTTFEEPQGWGTTNTAQDLLGDPVAVTKSTSAYSGSYAMKLESSTTSFVEALAGANPLVYNIGDGFAYTARPADLNFYYKYTFTGDTALVWVLFTASGGSQIIGEGEVFFTSTQNNYTLVNIPITYYSSANPDHVVIWIHLGDENTPSNNTGGSILYVDDFSFTGGNVGINDLSQNKQFVIYPNPVKDGIMNINLNVVSEKDVLKVLDVSGKVVLLEYLTGEKNKTIDLSDKSPGVYFVQLITDEKVINEKIVVH